MRRLLPLGSVQDTQRAVFKRAHQDVGRGLAEGKHTFDDNLSSFGQSVLGVANASSGHQLRQGIVVPVGSLCGVSNGLCPGFILQYFSTSSAWDQVVPLAFMYLDKESA